MSADQNRRRVSRGYVRKESNTSRRAHATERTHAIGEANISSPISPRKTFLSPPRDQGARRPHRRAGRPSPPYPPTIAAALSSALALFSVSSYSLAATESNTTPAPACT